MPCIKCNNGKWKYGEKGRCQFDTLEKCKEAAAAIHIHDKENNAVVVESVYTLDLKSSAFGIEGSSPSRSTKLENK